MGRLHRSTTADGTSHQQDSSSNSNDKNLRIIQQWSKKRLAETTDSSEMKLILGDIALRLNRQSEILDELQQQVLRSDATHWMLAQENGEHDYQQQQQRQQQQQQTMETIQKNLHSMKVLHRDTARTCQQFFANLPTAPLSPLLCHQVGQACKEIYARHALTIETMAETVIDIRRMLRNQERTSAERTTTVWTVKSAMAPIQSTVLRFLQVRLVTQLLCDHVVDCTLPSTRKKPHGAISVDVNVAALVTSAVLEARHLVETNFIPLADQPEAQAQECPEPPFVIVNEESTITATVVRPWLQYALVELLKNSLAITMERDRRLDAWSPYYPVLIEISETNTHVQIQLHDQGGGLHMASDGPHDNAGPHDTLFDFATRQDKWDRMDDQQTYATVSSPIRGLGVGLALSRLHLTRFGGDLTLQDRPSRTRTTTTTELEHAGVTATLRLSKNFDTIEEGLSS